MYVNWSFRYTMKKKLPVPADFDPAFYKKMYPELAHMSRRELVGHYVKYGYHEGRVYKNMLPPTFDPDSYRKLYSDLANLTDSELERHYATHGIKEGRTYQFDPKFGTIHPQTWANLGCIVRESKIYLINLARRWDRKRAVERQLRNLNLKHEILVATDGFKLIEEFESLVKEGNRFNSPGHLGCLYSHINAVRRAKQNGYKTLLIFEDDIYFHKNFWGILDNTYAPDDWDILYLGAKDLTRIYSVNELQVYRAFQTFGRFAYIIHERMYDGLLHLWEKKNKHGDRYLVDDVQPVYNCYVMKDNVVIANLEDSDSQPRQDLLSWSCLHNWDICNFEVYQTKIEVLVRKLNKLYVELRKMI